jgi:DNA helicase-2/ATP-dependent DNA helicase PcrA
VLVGARKFYERREVKDVVSYLRLVLNPTDDLAFLRVVNVPARGIGPKAIAEIQEIAAREGVPLLRAVRLWSEGSGRGRSGGREFAQIVEQLQELAKTLEPGALVEKAVEITGIGPELRAEDTDEARGRLENLEELASAAESEDSADEPLDRLVAFVDRASLAGQDEEIPDLEAGGKATLLTAHLAKGLEFPVVFVSGMVEGSFPHFRSLEREEDIEEERRLVYVAFTRAKERLFLTRPRRRMAGGQGYVDTDPSRFLAEVPREVLYTSVTAERAGYTPPASLIRAPPPRGRRPERIDPMRPVQGSLALEPGTRTIVPENVESFRPGTRVYHPAFGPGTVKRTEGSPQNLKIEIQFDASGRKTLYARHTNLELIV